MAPRALRLQAPEGTPDPGQAWLRSALSAAVHKLAPRAVRTRHVLHRYPELSNREFATARWVALYLQSLQLDTIVEGVANTGVVATLRGGRPGPVIALRADMDALPVTEATALPFRSRVRTELQGRSVGVSHACGHDIHTAVQLGVAAVLGTLRELMPGTVKFIFQPAEEGAPEGEEGGAALMIKEGVLEDPAPEAIFGLHTFPYLEVGKVGYTSGPAWAAVDRFRATICGSPAHGARPEAGVDPVVIAAEAILALQSICSRNVSPLRPAVLTVGRIQGGERFNSIPASVEIEGTVRSYDPEVRALIERRMREVLDGVCSAHGGNYGICYENTTQPVVNDAELTEEAVHELRETLGENNVSELDRSMGGEDFGQFTAEIPGFFYRLGSVRVGGRSGGFHTPTFEADDGAVEVGMRAMAGIVMAYLRARA